MHILIVTVAAEAMALFEKYHCSSFTYFLTKSYPIDYALFYILLITKALEMADAKLPV